MERLVVFYSRAGENYWRGGRRVLRVGNTEIAARILADAANAHLFQIRQAQPYAFDYDTCIAQARADLMAAARPALTDWPQNWNEYDEVYLGYPNYWGSIPMAVYTFLEGLDWAGKTIHPFCTHEGSGVGETARQIARAARGAVVGPALALTGSQTAEAAPLIRSWLSGDIR